MGQRWRHCVAAVCRVANGGTKSERGSWCRPPRLGRGMVASGLEAAQLEGPGPGRNPSVLVQRPSRGLPREKLGADRVCFMK